MVISLHMQWGTRKRRGQNAPQYTRLLIYTNKEDEDNAMRHIAVHRGFVEVEHSYTDRDGDELDGEPDGAKPVDEYGYWMFHATTQRLGTLKTFVKTRMPLQLCSVCPPQRDTGKRHWALCQ